MSLQKKYFYTFQDKNRVQYTTEIWQDTTDTIVSEEITGALNPFKIEYPTANLFDAVRGSGCEINIISTTDRKFFDLYTADMFEYQIRFYKGVNLIWCGYLDSELYTEPFNEYKNYTVTFTGSDGFALLERINYLQTDESKYSGLMLQSDVIKNILNKLNLPFKNIYVGLSTTSTHFTLAASETIFHKTYCNNQNWYNEDSDPETCRVVLEEILKPYAAFIIQDNANLYITDINTVAGASSASFKKYDNAFNYISTDSVNLYLGDLSSIKFATSSQQMTVVAGYNKQVITYSPYIDSDMVDFKADGDFTNLITAVTYGNSPYQWTEHTYINSNTWNKFYNVAFADYEGVQDESKEFYLRFVKSTYKNQITANNLSLTLKKELPVFIPANSSIKVSINALVRTSEDLNKTATTDKVYRLLLGTRIKIGSNYYQREETNVNGWNTTKVQGWTNSSTAKYQIDFEERIVAPTTDVHNTLGYFNDYTPIENNYLLNQETEVIGTGKNVISKKRDYLIPLKSGFTGGILEFEVYNFDIIPTYENNGATAEARAAIYQYYYDEAWNLIKDFRIKSINLSLVDENGNEYKNNDVEYIGYMNQKYKNEGDSITLLQGTSKIDNPIEKGCLMGFNTNYYYLKNWTRQSKTDNIENLLLRSIVSNYTNKRIELTATTNQLNSVLGCLKYDAFLAGKNLMIVGMVQNIADATNEITIQEITIDNLEINKSW